MLPLRRLRPPTGVSVVDVVGRSARSSAAPGRGSRPRCSRDGRATLRWPIARPIDHLFAAQRQTGAARSACAQSGPERAPRCLEARVSSGETDWAFGIARAPSAHRPGACFCHPPALRRDARTNGPMRPRPRPCTVAGRANGARCTTWPRDRHGRRSGRRWRRRPVQRKGAHPHRGWAPEAGRARAGTRAAPVYALSGGARRRAACPRAAARMQRRRRRRCQRRTPRWWPLAGVVRCVAGCEPTAVDAR